MLLEACYRHRLICLFALMAQELMKSVGKNEQLSLTVSYLQICCFLEFFFVWNLMDNMLVNLKFISFPELCLHIGGIGSRLKLKVLYGFAGGFYSYSIFALIFWETRRSDFGVSMSHHIVSVFLIVFSYLARFSSHPLPTSSPPTSRVWGGFFSVIC